MNGNFTMQLKISNLLVLTIILIILTSSICAQDNRNDYSGSVIYNKFILVDECSLYENDSYIPYFIADEKGGMKLLSIDTLEIFISSGFYNDTLEIYYNNKVIYNNVVTDKGIGIIGHLKINIDNYLSEGKLSVRMNHGKFVDIIINPKLNIVLIDYLFEIKLLQITNTNYVPIFG
jgi:hypothetical protein